MNSHLRHPEDDQLLRYADGELPVRQVRKVRSHLEACWQCRVQLEEMQAVVAECVRYRRDVLGPLLPAPPAHWDELSTGFAEIDERLARTSRVPLWARAKTWLPVAACLLAAFGLYYEMRHTPAVQAAELLQKAVAAADAHPAPRYRIRIRTRSQSLVRTAGANSEPAEATAVAAMFAAARFDWDDPLSARAFAQWREQLPDKRDEVSQTDNSYQIRTTTASGALAEATLQLRRADLHPVEERLEFRNQDWVEIEELSEVLPPPAVASNVTTPATKAVEIQADSEAIRTPAPAATVGDELAVLVALHQMGADLGEPIDVKREGGRVLVAGVGIDAARQREIARALAARSNVVVRFSEDTGSAPPPAKPLRIDTPAGTDNTALPARIETQVGGRADYERLSADLLDASESLMSRAYALRHLAERFPREIEPEMTGADRATLRALYREHAAALAAQAAAISRRLEPVLAPLGGKAAPASAVPSTAWQADTEELFRTARRIETLLAGMLGVAPGDTASLPSQLLSSLARLRAGAEAYGPGGVEGAAKR